MIALTGGTVYGWPAMRVMLLREAVIQSTSCPRNETSTSAVSPSSEAKCPERELVFGLIFTVGSWANQAGRLPAGILLDHAGPRVTATLSALFLSAGALTYGLALTSVAGLVCGYLLLGLGGAGIQISVQSTAALFPRNRSLAMSCMSGGYQFATGVLIVFEAIHRPPAGAPADAPPRLSLSWLMIIYAIIGGVLALLSLVTWPDAPFTAPAPEPTPDTHADAASWEGTGGDAQPGGGGSGRLEAGTATKTDPTAPDVRGTNGRGTTTADGECSSEESSAPQAAAEDGAARLSQGGSGCGEPAINSAGAAPSPPRRSRTSRTSAADSASGMLRTRSFRAQVTSVEFGLLLAWFAINMLQCQFTVGTVGLQFEIKGAQAVRAAQNPPPNGMSAALGMARYRRGGIAHAVRPNLARIDTPFFLMDGFLFLYPSLFSRW
jgi:MFS family permease